MIVNMYYAVQAACRSRCKVLQCMTSSLVIIILNYILILGSFSARLVIALHLVAICVFFELEI